MQTSEHAAQIQQAAAWIAAADALFIGTGAGMGVDSGLPDFRGSEGFWRAYPAYAKRGLRFEELANPRWFANDPTLAWGFYGHRRNLYRATTPHQGFAILQSWAAKMRHGGFAYTSNVDGQWQKSGWPSDRIDECHGAINALQCAKDCGQPVWSADGEPDIAMDAENFRAVGPLPVCPNCGAVARPNILMFGDWQWDDQPNRVQSRNLSQWLRAVEGASVVAVEIGAGTAIPSVRLTCERLIFTHNAKLVRLNPRECEVPDGQIGLPLGGLAGLQAMDAALRAL